MRHQLLTFQQTKRLTLRFTIQMNFTFYKTALLNFAFIPILFFSNCRSITKNKNILYDKERSLSLNVFSPKKTGNNNDVLIFIHGGNWKSGKKETYSFFAKRMAAKGIVTVVIDYRLTQDTDYYGMTMDVARAILWVKNNSAAYGGNPERIFVSGHSAGAHLGALVAMDERFFKTLNINNPVKGIVLIDAFGLDMYNYLIKYKDEYNGIYYPTFTTDQETWKKASPYYYISKRTPPVLTFLGGKTYPAITEYTNTFYTELKKYQPGAALVINPKRAHVGMMAQFYRSSHPNYNSIISFMQGTK